MDQSLPSRKHSRAQWHDYNGGIYFITFCVKDMKPSLGRIANGEIHLSVIGKKAENDIKMMLDKTHYAEVLSYVIMPNHIHLIIYISKVSSQRVMPKKKGGIGGFNSLLASVIGVLKAGITRYANKNNIPFSWHTGYHDHIIRDELEFNRIDKYIKENIQTWETDRFFRQL